MILRCAEKKLDSTGNWRNFREDGDGAGWDLNQQRTANKVNEITDIAESLGVSWVTPVYSKTGNMTTIPKPADPTSAFYATYDAWNRLVTIEEDDGMSGTWTVAEYEYDGAKRRSIKEIYASGVLDETRHFFYTEPSKWQVVEERVDSSSDTNRQFTWGPRYVDELVARDRDTTGDSALDERLYGMQDANWNVTSISNDAGMIQERYSYDAYGQPSFWSFAWSTISSSSKDYGHLYTGREVDQEHGLHYYRERYYDDGLGLFLSRDPIGYNADLNVHAYCGGSPVSKTDPSGLATYPFPSFRCDFGGGGGGTGFPWWHTAPPVSPPIIFPIHPPTPVRPLPWTRPWPYNRDVIPCDVLCDVDDVLKDPCWEDYTKCLLSGLSKIFNRCWDCYLACEGLARTGGAWKGTMNGQDCAYWKHP